MINFYKMLNLDPHGEASQIKENLQNKHFSALRKLNNTVGDADREYQVRKQIELIEGALEVFSDAETKEIYDGKLKEFESVQNKKAGPLMSGSLKEDHGSEKLNSVEKNMKDNYSDNEDNKKIQEILQKKIKDAENKQSSSNSNQENLAQNKAENYLIRAKQNLDLGRFEESRDFIEAALNEDATYFPAWELMFNNQVKAGDAGEYDPEKFTFRFPAFYQKRELENYSKHEIKKALTILNKLPELREYFNRPQYKLSELQDLKNDIDLAVQWLESQGPENMVDIITSTYSQAAPSTELNYYYNQAYMFEDARVAYQNAMKYANKQQELDLFKNTLNLLKEIYFNNLKKAQEYYQAKAKENCNRLFNEVRDYQKRVELTLAKSNKGKEKKTKIGVVSSLGVSLFIQLLFSAGYGPAIFSDIFTFLKKILFLNNETFFNLQVLFFRYELLTLLITFGILGLSFKYIADTKDKTLYKIQSLIIFIAVACYGYYGFKYWNYHGFFTFLFRIGFSVYLGTYLLKLSSGKDLELVARGNQKEYSRIPYFYGA